MKRNLKSLEEESTEALARMQSLNDELENTINSFSMYHSENKCTMVQAYKDSVRTLEDKLNLFKFSETQSKEENIVILDDFREKIRDLDEIEIETKLFKEEQDEVIDNFQDINDNLDNTLSTKKDIEIEVQQLKEAMNNITGKLVTVMEMIDAGRTDRDTDISDV